MTNIYDATRSAWTQPLAVVYWPYCISQTLEEPYCYYKLVTNIIIAVKLNVLSFPWSDIPWLSANQKSGLEPPSL